MPSDTHGAIGAIVSATAAPAPVPAPPAIDYVIAAAQAEVHSSGSEFFAVQGEVTGDVAKAKRFYEAHPVLTAVIVIAGAVAIGCIGLIF